MKWCVVHEKSGIPIEVRGFEVHGDALDYLRSLGCKRVASVRRCFSRGVVLERFWVHLVKTP